MDTAMALALSERGGKRVAVGVRSATRACGEDIFGDDVVEDFAHEGLGLSLWWDCGGHRRVKPMACLAHTHTHAHAHTVRGFSASCLVRRSRSRRFGFYLSSFGPVAGGISRLGVWVPPHSCCRRK